MIPPTASAVLGIAATPFTLFADGASAAKQAYFPKRQVMDAVTKSDGVKNKI